MKNALKSGKYYWDLNGGDPVGYQVLGLTGGSYLIKAFANSFDKENPYTVFISMFNLREIVEAPPVLLAMYGITADDEN